MAKGGARKGAGRKPGSKSPATLERERVLAALRQRIMQRADRILDSQMSLALGQQFLFKIEKTKIIGPKGGVSYHPEKPELVTSEAEIRDYLDDLVHDVDIQNKRNPGATYYFITTKEPSNQALDSMLNRALGKPTENVEVTGANGAPLVDMTEAIKQIIKRQ